MPATPCEIALCLSLIKQWAVVVQLKRYISAIWNLSMGRPFLDPTFHLNLQGSTSGKSETGTAEETVLDGAGSWAKELLQ